MGGLGLSSAMSGVEPIVECDRHGSARDVFTACRHMKAESMKHRLGRRQSFLKVCTWVVLTGSTVAQASNTEPLVQILAPANLALTLSNVCLGQDASFAGKTTGKAGPIEVYAQYVKTRVSEDLDGERLNIVLRRAAGIARQEALIQVRQHKGGSPTEEAQRLRHWCATSAASTIRSFITLMDERRADFEKALTEAKE